MMLALKMIIFRMKCNVKFIQPSNHRAVDTRCTVQGERTILLHSTRKSDVLRFHLLLRYILRIIHEGVPHVGFLLLSTSNWHLPPQMSR